jgi:hypothetical protein
MTVGEEFFEIIPQNTQIAFLAFGLHDYPDMLNSKIQEEINRTVDVDAILLGYGLCSKGTLGLSSTNCHLVIPRMQDCIGIFMGSDIKYRKEFFKEPGTYYLTKGWINHGGDPYKMYLEWQNKYGSDKARVLLEKTIGNYKRLAFIQTGRGNQSKYIRYSKTIAKKLGLKFEIILGNNHILTKMIRGEWDNDFVVIAPGETINLNDFFSTAKECKSLSRRNGAYRRYI